MCMCTGQSFFSVISSPYSELFKANSEILRWTWSLAHQHTLMGKEVTIGKGETDREKERLHVLVAHHERGTASLNTQYL